MASKFPSAGHCARTFYLLEDEFAEFQAIMKFEEASASALVREFVRDVVAKYKLQNGVDMANKLDEKNIASLCTKGKLNT